MTRWLTLCAIALAVAGVVAAQAPDRQRPDVRKRVMEDMMNVLPVRRLLLAAWLRLSCGVRCAMLPSLSFSVVRPLRKVLV